MSIVFSLVQNWRIGRISSVLLPVLKSIFTTRAIKRKSGIKLLHCLDTIYRNTDRHYTTLYTLHYTYLNYFYLNIEVVEARKASEPDLAVGLEPRVTVSMRGGPLVQFLMSVDGGGGGGGGPGEALVLITRSRAADWWLCSVPTLSLLSPS